MNYAIETELTLQT